jgi:hypothetical protein
MTRSLRIISLLVLTLGLSIPAFGYTIVNTSAPAINCVFSTTCSVGVIDMGSDMPNGGRIQSRIFQGQPGSPAAGKYVYEYRINMSNAVGVVNIPYANALWIANWGPVLSYDYNFDSVATDHVFVVTAGGIGTKAPTNASTSAPWTFFQFSNPVYGGSFPGDGESSYFFGLVSNYPPVTKTGWIYTDAGWVSVNVYAPQYP